MLSRERIEAIRARAAAATPYPWEWEAADGSMLALGTKGAALVEGNVLMCARCEACQEHNKPCMWPKKPDADFIAHARQDVPDLLEHIDALETVLRRVREWSQRDIAYMGCPFRGSDCGVCEPGCLSYDIARVLGMPEESE